MVITRHLKLPPEVNLCSLVSLVVCLVKLIKFVIPSKENDEQLSLI